MILILIFVNLFIIYNINKYIGKQSFLGVSGVIDSNILKSHNLNEITDYGNFLKINKPETNKPETNISDIKQIDKRVAGEDDRFPKAGHEILNFEIMYKIGKIYHYKKLLDTLINDAISIQHKLSLIGPLKDNEVIMIDITKGGLLNDWDFQIG